MDLSQVPIEALQKIAAQNQASSSNTPAVNSPDLSSLSTEQLQQIASKNQSISDKIKGAGTAAVAGIANAGASALESGVDAALWATDKLGITNPEISSIAKQNLNQDLTKLARSGVAGAPNDVFTQAYQQNPVIGKGTEAATDIGLLTATTPGQLIKGAGILKATDLAARTGINALIGAGIGGPNTESANMGAALSSIGGIAGDVVGKGLSSAANKLQLDSKIKDFVSPFVKSLANDNNLPLEEKAMKAEGIQTQSLLDINNANYDVLKQIPGTIPSKPIQDKINQLFQDSGSKIIPTKQGTILNHQLSTIDKPQIAVLTSIQNSSSKLNSMEDALQLSQYISKNKPLFQGTGVDKDVMQTYTDLQNTVKNLIDNKANSAGVGDALKKANEFNKFYVQPLYESGAVDRLDQLNLENQRQIVSAQASTKGLPEAPVNPEYVKSLKNILPANPTPDQLNATLSRMDDSGKQIYSQLFLKNTFKDLYNENETFNKNTSLMKVNNLISKYKDVLPTESANALNGIKQILIKGGAEAKPMTQESNMYFWHFLGHAIGGSAVGGLIGYEEGGYEGAKVGAGIGGAAGIFAIPKIAGAVGSFTKGLIETPNGQKVLSYIGTHPEAAQKLVTSAAKAASGSLNTKAGSNSTGNINE